MPNKNIATGIGFIAILLWALLALFTAASGSVPPFLMTSVAMGIGGLIGVVNIVARGRSWAFLRQPMAVWMLGVIGISGYHFAYFTALQNAPPVEAGLIAYLWPLLIVLFSALLPGERLRWFHVAGALLGLVGAGLIVTKGGQIAFEAEYAFGYVMAIACALIWSSYSVLSRRFAEVPTDIVVGYCIIGSVLTGLGHLTFETTVWPTEPIQWAALIGLGLGPVGLAFYVWDYGIKRGDVPVLGAASYLAPLLSTLVLIVAGFAEFTWMIGAACLLITFGALLASRDLLLSLRR